MDLQLSNIGEAIQLATAPVFLLAGVGTMLIVLTNRLGRLIDRSRVLEERLKMRQESDDVGELLNLHHRARLINVGIAASTACGLLICVVIATLFLEGTTDLPLDQYIVLCFVGGMLALIVGFVYLMREIVVCCSFMRAQQLAALAGCGATGR
ncbi:hypothetical protein ABIB38_004352 [Massilia sp. UYP11]|uniref:DUF2721 domain-containing protein n=1 Tax=Massilia sp. UYP11 TaxID=1756385 RepID=UPI003D1F9302